MIDSLLVSQETLATKEELKAFASHATQAAAIDYIISVESDVFIPSYSGNMARAVEGHRRFLGHRRTIAPDRYYIIKNMCYPIVRRDDYKHQID